MDAKLQAERSPRKQDNLLVSHELHARACLLLDLLLDLLLLAHHFAQLLLLLLQLILHLVHPLLVLLDLLVLRGQLLIELLDLHFIVIQFKELQLDLRSHHLVLQALVAVGLCKQGHGVRRGGGGGGASVRRWLPVLSQGPEAA